MIIGCCLFEGAAYILSKDGDIWKAFVNVDDWMEFEHPDEIPHEVLQAFDEQQILISKEQGMRVCPECNGIGRIEDEDGEPTRCPECHGSGVIDDSVNDLPVIREPDA